ncbi:MAG: FRG domain-containing protein [Methanothrix sp.]
MKETSIRSWDEFVEQVEKLQAERDAYAKQTSSFFSELLYRGQRDSCMKLETTLERSIPHEITLSKYYNFVYIIRAKIESVTGKDWCIPSREEFEKWCDEQHIPLHDIPGYSFLAYLRHHGLPSPLLDWTRSPYVAAHFAMAPPPLEGVQHAAIYVYHEAKGWKNGDDEAPAIQSLGPYVTTHRRHYLQQSEYTICTAGKGRLLRYASHETVVARDDNGQDGLWKLIIPISERVDFIEHLQRMNINPFSLFETEDSLMEDIYLSEMFLRKRL